jgi:hypothetical protein
MSYKTILAYLNDKRRAEAVLEPAVQLAGRSNAHLIGMHVYPGVPAPPVPLPYGSEVVTAVAGSHGRRDRAQPLRRPDRHRPEGP